MVPGGRTGRARKARQAASQSVIAVKSVGSGRAARGVYVQYTRIVHTWMYVGQRRERGGQRLTRLRGRPSCCGHAVCWDGGGVVGRIGGGLLDVLRELRRPLSGRGGKGRAHSPLRGF